VVSLALYLGVQRRVVKVKRLVERAKRHAGENLVRRQPLVGVSTGVTYRPLAMTIPKQQQQQQQQ
jgi:hypothetical protein